jgi:hypothetical protein
MSVVRWLTIATLMNKGACVPPGEKYIKEDVTPHGVHSRCRKPEGGKKAGVHHTDTRLTRTPTTQSRTNSENERKVKHKIKLNVGKHERRQ